MSGTKQDYINYRITKAHETLMDAKILASSQRWNSCVNRLYYACFYIVNALLYQNNIQVRTHNGIKSNFFLQFVKPNLVSKELGNLFSNLFDWRQETDYTDFINFDEQTVKPLIEQVESFNTIEQFIQK